jgi:hypothetical protein
MGSSGWSSVLDVRTAAHDATPPSRMRAPELSSGSDSVCAQWVPPSTDGGSPIARYEARAERGSDGRVLASCTAPAAARNCTILGLPPKVALNVSVRAVNFEGASEWSPHTSSATGGARAPDEPLAPGVLPSNTMTIAWQQPAAHGSAVTKYELQVDDWWRHNGSSGAGNQQRVWVTIYSGGSRQLDTCTTVAGALTQCGAPPPPLRPVPPEPEPLGLLPSIAYAVRVRASNAVGWSGWSAPGAITPAVSGHCGSETQLQIWHDEIPTLRSRLTTAMMKCLLAKDLQKCAAQKLHEDLGFSFDCADCWAADAVCSKNNCNMCVFQPHGEKCTECARTHCSAALYACTGLPDWVFPP